MSVKLIKSLLIVLDVNFHIFLIYIYYFLFLLINVDVDGLKVFSILIFSNFLIFLF